MRNLILHFSLGLFSLFGLTACEMTQEAPIEQMQRSQIIAALAPTEMKATETVSLAKKQTTNQFVCKDGKTVKIQRATTKSTSSHERAILVSFAGSSHTLSPVVSKTGKKIQQYPLALGRKAQRQGNAYR